jgi:hypothetical protein
MVLIARPEEVLHRCKCCSRAKLLFYYSTVENRVSMQDKAQPSGKLKESDTLSSFFDRTVVTGFAISAFASLIVAIVPSFFSQDKSLSLIVGLVGVIVTLLFDLNQKLVSGDTSLTKEIRNGKDAILNAVEKEQDTIADVVELGEALVSDPFLRKIIEDIVEDCEEVKMRNVSLFVDKMESTLQGCSSVIRDLARGEQDVEGRWSIRSAGLGFAKSCMRFVQYDPPSYFATQLGKNYLQSQRQAIQRNVSIIRIWLQERRILTDPILSKIILEHADAGIETLVIEKDMLPPEAYHLCEDYGIIDDIMLITPLAHTNGASKGEHITIDLHDIERAKNNFDALKGYAQEAHDYYRQQTFS